MDAEGFEPNDSLRAAREKCVSKQEDRAAKVDTVSQKLCKMDNQKRPARDSPESLTASTSNESESRQSNSLKGGKLSYETLGMSS